MKQNTLKINISRIYSSVPRKMGGHQVILNLKHLNLSVTIFFLKMQSLQSAINLMTAGCYMASIDSKDAYYTVPVDTRYRKYLHLFGRTKNFLLGRKFLEEQIVAVHLFAKWTF